MVHKHDHLFTSLEKVMTRGSFSRGWQQVKARTVILNNCEAWIYVLKDEGSIYVHKSVKYFTTQLATITQLQLSCSKRQLVDLNQQYEKNQ